MRHTATLALLAALGFLAAAPARGWSDYEVFANNALSRATGRAATGVGPLLPPLHSNVVPASNLYATWAPTVRGPFEASRAPLDRRDPSVERRDPDVDRRDPNVDRRNPNVDQKDPSVDRKDPSVDRKDPNVDRRDPNVDRRNPNVDRKDPSVDRKDPSVDRRNPSVDRRNPNVDRRNPNVDRKDPSVDRRDRNARRRKPSGERRRKPNGQRRRQPNELARREPSSRRKEPNVRRDPSGNEVLRREPNARRKEPKHRPGLDSVTSRNRSYSCPTQFIRHGQSCYSLSADMATWQDAHFRCRDLGAQLARLEQRWEDRNVRAYLANPELAPLERWIGGIYDWELKQWVWGASAHVLGYQGFSRRKAHADQRWQCIALDPRLLFRWTPRSCLEPRHFLCETPLVENRT